MAAPPPPALPGELVEEILLRLPPDEPACLLRASLVCKTWSGIVSHRAFRRHLHELHGAPPVLGFLHNWDDEVIPRFIPTTASSFSLAAPHRQFWRALDSRHGRALFLSEGDGTQELLLWEPTTGVRHHVPVPAAYDYETVFQPNAAVLCAADPCDHRDCLGGPFCLVFVFSVEEDTDDEEEYVTSACVYSSDTGTWGELTSMHVDFLIDFTYYSRVLVVRSLVYFMATGGSILEYDLARHDLNVFEPPDYDLPHSERLNLILAEDGGLGVSQALDSHLKLWSREVASNGTDAQWVLSRVINLKNLLPMRALAHADYSLLVLGFAEGANVIFVNMVAGLFTIELHSERVRKVCHNHGFCNLVPVIGFYTPRSRLEALGDEHHDLLPPLNITEEVGGEEEDKTLQRARKLFDKWWKDIEEGGFTNTTDFFSHALEIRVPLSPGWASILCRCGRALLCKAMKATNPSRNGSKSSSNEESIKSTATASKDDSECSEAFGSNVEQAPSEKVDSEEGKNMNGKNQEDRNVAGGGDDSDLDLAWKMLHVARAIVTKSPDMTMEKVDIFHGLAEVCKKREDRDNAIGYYSKSLAILEHLVRPDHIRIVDLYPFRGDKLIIVSITLLYSSSTKQDIHNPSAVSFFWWCITVVLGIHLVSLAEDFGG
ncbi:hypothetical protein VPH35_068622 [Triticum aestivum]|uniref:uncharacterized protein n=1 Tax=Triticum aestivum TaxID=4565 RepID=UPI001D016D39|nr:uncharacterized protein LOC123082803 [Triticum aestivum]